LIVFTPRAGQQVRELRQHYEERERPEAIRALAVALDTAWQNITSNPATGLAAPRPYPRPAQPGRAWVKSGRYWVAYSTTPSPVIIAVFYDAADIPSRL
jgi:plasmid stabilization system protein ParE